MAPLSTSWLRPWLSVCPASGGRNSLNLLKFRDGSDPGSSRHFENPRSIPLRRRRRGRGRRKQLWRS
ncbi:unnamed protein product [Linum trigynum]|uniref:Uncharacterized protein n=1 Tax=Linum trigynum TaxID=586398 RepID=A0AAV2EMU6_9ROSI